LLVKELQALGLKVTLALLKSGGVSDRFPKRPRAGRARSFDYIQIRIASPEEIRGPKDSKERERLELQGQRTWWSWGEVTKPETDPTTGPFKPERDGLFCERIFGPVKDWELPLREVQADRYRGVICDRCGVEVTLSKVRRERHGPRSRLAVRRSRHLVLQDAAVADGVTPARHDAARPRARHLLHGIDVGVTSRGRAEVQERELLDEDRFSSCATRPSRGRHGVQGGHRVSSDPLACSSGSTSITPTNCATPANETSQHRQKQMLKSGSTNLDAMRNLRHSRRYQLATTRAGLNSRRLPVIPDRLRPGSVPLDEAGRSPTSDLNDIVPRVINGTPAAEAHLHRAPEVILRNEKRMLQEQVGTRWFDNGRRFQGDPGTPASGPSSAVRHAEGQAVAIPSEPAWQRVDYSPFVIRLRTRVELHSVRSAQGDGGRTVQALHHPQAGEKGSPKTVKRAKRSWRKECRKCTVL